MLGLRLFPKMQPGAGPAIFHEVQQKRDFTYCMAVLLSPHREDRRGEETHLKNSCCCCFGLGVHYLFIQPLVSKGKRDTLSCLHCISLQDHSTTGFCFIFIYMCLSIYIQILSIHLCVYNYVYALVYIDRYASYSEEISPLATRKVHFYQFNAIYKNFYQLSWDHQG